ncbi:MAG TPA: hypothetical protein VH374_22590 [Polyangia bacterium]|nr:hypothetical protein [Polyangia bacterium]
MARRWAGIVFGVVAGSLLAAPPAHAAKPRIAIIGLTMGDVTAEVRIKMNAAIVGGLIASGAEVADSTATGRAMAERGMVACDTATCLIEIGKASGAAFVLRGSMEMTGRSYVIRLEMIDAATATVIDTREDRCEICTENEASETASVSASALKAQVFRRRTPPARPSVVAASPSPAPEPSPRGQVEPLLIDTPPASPSPAEVAKPLGPPSSSHALAWTAGAVALAAIAAGLTLITVDNSGGHKTMTSGLVVSGLGLAAAAASVLAYTGHF